jgi:acyl carrier protein
MASFDRNDTLQKIVDVIVKELKIEPSAVKVNVTFQDLGVDSLDMVQIIMKCEEQFGLEIPDETAEQFHTINDVVDYINERRSK